MARARAENYAEQREGILNHAATLFAKKGYVGTSMNDVALACGLSKPTLYHYYRDKDEMLASIAEGHVSRLVQLVDSVEAESPATPQKRLELLITRFLLEYSHAQDAHRVLTEDVKFLPAVDRERILDQERYVVEAYAQAIGALRPDVQTAGLEKPVSMLLFGMLNWMFTWLKPNGPVTHESIAPLVCDLFFNGLTGVSVQGAPAAKKAAGKRSRASR
jgi:TetR/AcrR family transcriptional regulator